MDNTIIPQIKKTLKKSFTLFEGILPFTEKPSNKHLSERNETAKDEIPASDLFSLFTADIIKEEIIFTR